MTSGSITRQPASKLRRRISTSGQSMVLGPRCTGRRTDISWKHSLRRSVARSLHTGSSLRIASQPGISLIRCTTRLACPDAASNLTRMPDSPYSALRSWTINEKAAGRQRAPMPATKSPVLEHLQGYLRIQGHKDVGTSRRLESLAPASRASLRIHQMLVLSEPKPRLIGHVRISSSCRRAECEACLPAFPPPGVIATTSSAGWVLRLSCISYAQMSLSNQAITKSAKCLLAWVCIHCLT